MCSDSRGLALNYLFPGRRAKFFSYWSKRWNYLLSFLWPFIFLFAIKFARFSSSLIDFQQIYQSLSFSAFIIFLLFFLVLLVRPLTLYLLTLLFSLAQTMNNRKSKSMKDKLNPENMPWTRERSRMSLKREAIN